MRKKNKEEDYLIEETSTNEQEESKVINILGQIRGTLIMLLVVIGVVFIINAYVGRVARVEGHSMDPTLHDGEYLIMDRLSYRYRDPKRFEIVIFPHGKKFFIKRIIGLPGETVRIQDGKFYINDKLLDDDIYGAELIEKYTYGVAKDTIYLGEDEYFCVGDNRNHSGDSRVAEVGNIKRADFTGRAIFRIWPFQKIWEGLS